MRSLKLFCAAAALALAAGCATYTTPGAGVSIGDLSKADPDIAERMKAEPAATFPSRIAVARVQASGYYADGTSCWGSGKFCVVTARDIEGDGAFDKLGDQSGVAGVAVVNRMILPATLWSRKDLREGAASLRADMLLVYSVDTRFTVENTDIGPLALISLGFLPNKNAKVTATASAALFDTRTGFVYGLAESTAVEEQRATFWSSNAAIENARRKAEAEAFRKMVGEVGTLWRDVVRTHGRKDKPV